MPTDTPDPAEQKRSNGDSSSKTNWVQVGNYAQLAFLFPAATLVGWLIGVALD
jgi:hypothetical protein